MILDERLEFADATAFNTGAPGTFLVGDVIDIGLVNPQRDIGNGQPVYFVVTCATAATGGATTVQFVLASDAQAAITTNATETRHYVSRVIPLAEITAGAMLVIVALPWEKPVYEQFIGVLQITGGAAFTAGAFNAFLTLDPSLWKAYADAVN